MRAATIAVVNEAGGGVVESSVEIVAGTLSVELARAVGNVGLSSGQTEVKSLEELEHLVRIHNLYEVQRFLLHQSYCQRHLLRLRCVARAPLASRRVAAASLRLAAVVSRKMLMA